MKKITGILLMAAMAVVVVLTGCKKAPVADFSASSTTVYTYQNVNFTDNSSHSPDSWTWTFTGGTPSTSGSQNPTVYWTVNGQYNVALASKNKKGESSTSKSNYMTVKPDLTIWSNFSGPEIAVYMSTSAITSADTNQNNYMGRVTSYYATNPGCGGSGCVSANAHGTIYYYCAELSGALHYWDGNTTIVQGCNTINLVLSKSKAAVEIANTCVDVKVDPAGKKM
jgi:PKD repeat protein